MSKEVKEKKPMKKSKKILLGIGIVLLSALFIYTCVWTYNYYRFYRWEHMMEYDERRQDYCYVEDGYLYYVAKPHNFLMLSGNFSIMHSIGGLNEEEGIQLGVIIWPRLDGSYDIGVQITLIEWNEKRNDFDYTNYQAMLDENLDLDLTEHPVLDEDEKKVVQGFYDNREELDKLLNKARELWGILE